MLWDAIVEDQERRLRLANRALFEALVVRGK